MKKTKEQLEAEAKAKEAQEAEVKSQLKALIDERVDEVKKELEQKYQNEFDTRMAEHKEAMEKKAGIYSADVRENRKALNERTRELVKAVMSGDMAVAKSLGTSPNANAGYLLDSELANEIERLATEYGVARREMRVVPISKSFLKIPVALADINVYWTGEKVAKTSTQPTFDQRTLSLKKIAAIVPMSDEFIEDIEFDIFGYIADVAAEKIAQKEDLAFFKGDGTSGFGGFTGLLKSNNVGEVIMETSEFEDMTADDLLDLIDTTPEGGRANGKFYMHRTVRSVVRKLKDEQGRYVYQGPSEKDPGTIWERPVVEVEAFPSISDSAPETSFVLFGNLRKAAWLGTKKSGMTMAVSNEATVHETGEAPAAINLFEQDMTAIRIVERVGYTEVLPLAVSKLTTGEASN